MALMRIADAVVEPVTLDEARAHLRAATTLEDAIIASLIKVARVTCEDRLQRALIASSWRLTIDAFSPAIALRMPRIISVTSIKYVDEDGVQQILSPASYLVDTASEPGWIVPANGYAWPATRDQINAVEIEFSAGYGATAADVPAPIRQWILLMVGTLYENRETVVTQQGIVSVSLGFTDRLLDTYRVFAG